MLENKKSSQTFRKTRQVKPDTPTKRLLRFALGSIFGVVFTAFCFLLLTFSLKGPDTIEAEGEKTAGKLGLIGSSANERLRIGNPAPDFVLTQLGGNPVQLSNLRGKTVLINFWATWCAPCKEEMPVLQEFYLKNRNANKVVVLTINVRENEAAVKHFFKENNLNMPVLLDPTGEVPGGYRVTGYPESYIVDKNGNIGGINIGVFTEIKALEDKFQLVWQNVGQ